MFHDLGIKPGLVKSPKDKRRPDTQKSVRKVLFARLEELFNFVENQRLISRIRSFLHSQAKHEMQV